jgi:hypothetical protein
MFWRLRNLQAAKKEAAVARVRIGLCGGVKMSLHLLVLPKVQLKSRRLGNIHTIW